MTAQSTTKPASSGRAKAVPRSANKRAEEKALAEEAAALLSRIRQQLDEAHARADRLLARLD